MNSTNHLQRRRLLRILATSAATILGSAGIAFGQVNLLSNPGAEANSYSGWNLFGNPAGNGNYDYAINNGTGGGATLFDGAYTFKMYGNYDTGPNKVSGMSQTFSAHPGEVLTAGVESQSLSTDYIGQNNNSCWVDVMFEDPSHNVLARYRSLIITNGFIQDTWVATPVTNQWSTDGSTLIGPVDPNLVAPAGTAYVQFQPTFSLINYGGGSIYWDDFYLNSTVPPPQFTNVAPANGLLMATNKTLSFDIMGPANITNLTMAVTTTPLGSFANTVNYDQTSGAITVTGFGTTAIHVSLPLTSNTTYSVSSTASDTNGFQALNTTTFDTVQPVVLWEAEDYNYNNGLEFDSGVNQYAGQNGVDQVDENKVNGPTANGANAVNDHRYRPNDLTAIDFATEVGAFRIQYTPSGGAYTDYDIGYASKNDWLNYTRTFPAGKYNVYARLATSGSASVGLGIVSNPTSSSQTVSNLGTCSFSGGNWNQYYYVPLEDQYGNTLPVSLSGAQTIRATQMNATAANANFYFVVPAQPQPNPTISGVYPTGSRPFEPTNSLSFTVGQGQGTAITANQIHLLVNGADVTSSATITASSTNWIVSYPLLPDRTYTAYMSVTNSQHLPAFKSITFDTFSQNNYMWEGEDYDFNGGQFIDNPIPTADLPNAGTGLTITGGEIATNSYYNFPAENVGATAVYGVDAFCGTDSGEAFNYRQDSDALVGCQPSADFLRQKFVDSQNTLGDTNITDFNIGWFNPEWWLNYTRHFPAGTYNIWGRLATGSPYTNCILSKVTSGWGTMTQTTNVLGYFTDPNASGYQAWHWVPLADTQGNMVAVAFDGNTNTLKITSVGLNVNFIMLVPAVGQAGSFQVSPSVVGNQLRITFPTQANHTYTVQSSSVIKGGIWGGVSVITGDGANKTYTATIGGSGPVQFYRVVAQ